MAASTFKRCHCANKKTCAHAYYGQSHQVKMSLEVFAKRPVRTEAEMKKVLPLFEAAVLKGEVHRGLRKEHYTIKDLVGDYLELHFLPKGRSYKGTEEYRFKAILEHFGPIQPENLSLIDVDRWLLLLKKRGMGPGTVRKYVARLKAILTWGFDRELFPSYRIRWKALDLASASEGRARRLEAGEEEKLKSGASPWLKDVIEAALDTGLRAGSLLGLQFKHLTDDGTALVVPRSLLKNKKATHDLRMPLTLRLQELIKLRQGRKQLGPDCYIFGMVHGKKRKRFDDAWNYSRTAAGLSADAPNGWGLHWHDLRGEFATRLHEAGVAIETISYLLDHSTVEMTRRYIKVRTRSSKPGEAIAALDSLHEAFALAEKRRIG